MSRTGRKRSQADVERAEAAERKKAEKQRRRERKAREEAERNRAITRLREDYRNAVNAVRSGQYRMNWTPNSTIIRIAGMAQPGEQAAPPFVTSTHYESTRALPPPLDPRLQRELQPTPATLRPPATRATHSMRPPTPAPAALRPPSLFSGGLLPLPPPPVPPTRQPPPPPTTTTTTTAVKRRKQLG
uniref:BZIP domain-containing protein n=1 Tax=Globodera pallida TaxID=36090 RepID=A0A183CET3_GLOPA